jgi:hypothetical protein
LGGKRHVCAGLRSLESWRLAGITQTFFVGDSPIATPGDGRAMDAKRKIKKIESEKLQNQENENLQNFHRKFVLREIDLESLREIVFLF